MEIQNLLLTVFIVAFVLMIIACICGVLTQVIARRAMVVIHESAPDLYRNILNGSESSWIERRADSLRDFPIWWNLYKTIYRRGEIEDVVGQRVVARFIHFCRVMLASYFSAILLGIGVITAGFVLASASQ